MKNWVENIYLYGTKNGWLISYKEINRKNIRKYKEKYKEM